jgi:hypothetical protein
MQSGIPFAHAPMRLKLGLLIQQTAGARRPYKGARTRTVHAQGKTKLFISCAMTAPRFDHRSSHRA